MGTYYSTLLDDFVEEVNPTEEKINQISILDKNETVAEYKWKEPEKQNMHSIAKSFVSLAVGLAIDEGLITMEETVAQLFPEKLTNENCQQLESLTLHHLLTLSIGQNKAHLMLGKRKSIEETDWIDFCVNQPFVHNPGEVFLYSNVGPYLAGRAVEERSGQNLIHYLTPRILAPMGFSPIEWERDPRGHIFGAGGIVLTPGDLKKLGRLYLNNGNWKGNQLVPSDWIHLSSQPHIQLNELEPCTTHYGYGLWINEREKSFRADGAFGQIVLIFPEKEAAVVMCSTRADNHKSLERISRLLYPSL